MKKTNVQMKEHWNNIYASREVDTLAWYEEKPTPSLSLLAKCNIRKDDSVVDIGACASTFIDFLIEKQLTSIIAVDISEVALSKLQARLGKEKASRVKWIVDDVTDPKHINKLRDIAVWHDRALLHFLLEEDQKLTYFTTLKKIVKKEGYVIIAAFSLRGARRCNGLDVRNYDSQILTEDLGKKIALVEAFDYTYQMPSGDARPYVYTLFHRIGSS